MKVSIARNNYSFVVIWVFDHSMKNQLGIDIAFYFTSDFQYWFKNKDKPIFLQRLVKVSVCRNIPDEKECFSNIIFIR